MSEILAEAQVGECYAAIVKSRDGLAMEYKKTLYGSYQAFELSSELIECFRKLLSNMESEDARP